MPENKNIDWDWNIVHLNTFVIYGQSALVNLCNKKMQPADGKIYIHVYINIWVSVNTVIMLTGVQQHCLQ